MNTKQERTSRSALPDPLIDEVRSLRRSLCDSVANDVDRLCDHLEQIVRDYRDRKGDFASVPRQLDSELFPEAGNERPDPLIDEVRSLRRGESERQ
jgi:hypothetical protein